MIKPDFAEGANGKHKDIYMRLLRDEITAELKLTDSMVAEDFDFGNNPRSEYLGMPGIKMEK